MKIELTGILSGLEVDTANIVNDPEPTRIGRITIDTGIGTSAFSDFKTRVPMDSVLGQKVKITVESLTQE